jgi:inosine/xanthosine triphosphate pyrophosphatase family protein
MTLEEKNLVSHRGLALQDARTLIIEHLNRRIKERE